MAGNPALVLRFRRARSASRSAWTEATTSRTNSEWDRCFGGGGALGCISPPSESNELRGLEGFVHTSRVCCPIRGLQSRTSCPHRGPSSSTESVPAGSSRVPARATGRRTNPRGGSRVRTSRRGRHAHSPWLSHRGLGLGPSAKRKGQRATTSARRRRRSPRRTSS